MNMKKEFSIKGVPMNITFVLKLLLMLVCMLPSFPSEGEIIQEVEEIDLLFLLIRTPRHILDHTLLTLLQSRLPCDIWHLELNFLLFPPVSPTRMGLRWSYYWLCFSSNDQWGRSLINIMWHLAWDERKRPYFWGHF